MKNRIKIYGIALLCVIMIVFCFAGCASETSNIAKDEYNIDSNGNSMSGEYSINNIDGTAETDETNGENVSEKNTSQKIIYTADIQSQTKKFDDSLDKLNELIKKNDAYISDSTISGGLDYSGEYQRNKVAEIQIKVPAKNFNAFVSGTESFSNIVNKEISSENVTLQYVDYQTQLDNLKNQEKRLNELMSQAKDLDQILKIENQITTVRTNIDKITRSFEALKDQVSYSTVNFRLEEVREYNETISEKSFGEKLVSTFKDSWVKFYHFLQNLVLTIIALLPGIIFIGIITIIIIAIIKTNEKKQKAKRMRNTQTNQNQTLQKQDNFNKK